MNKAVAIMIFFALYTMGFWIATAIASPYWEDWSQAMQYYNTYIGPTCIYPLLPQSIFLGVLFGFIAVGVVPVVFAFEEKK